MKVIDLVQFLSSLEPELLEYDFCIEEILDDGSSLVRTIELPRVPEYEPDPEIVEPKIMVSTLGPEYNWELTVNPVDIVLKRGMGFRVIE